MERINALLKTLYERFFSTTYQLQRIVILAGVAAVLVLGSFAGYYYYDRYYTSQPKVAEMGITQAEQALRDDPQNPDKRVALAETYLLNRRFDEAISLTSDVLKAYPDKGRALLVYGVASAESGKPEQAIEPLQKFIDTNKDADFAIVSPELQSAAYYLGDSYLKTNQPDKAIEPLEMAYQLNGTDADTIYKLGMAQLALKDYEKALILFHTAVAFVPDYREAYEGMVAAYEARQEPALVTYAKGMIAYSEKDYSAALKLLLESAQAEPAFAPTFAGLGQTYEALNDLPNAKAAYETSLKLHSDNFTAAIGLQRVEAGLKK